ncbi:MAG: flagellar hook assembly protein FlgD [Acetobacteraceae bacterium]|nr:flagellar hook assembly protein FlgD [Acetobacteraceae bacterium]
MTATASTAATSAAQAPPSGTAAARNRVAMDQASFLQLLTTQLRNQDPSSPMDTNAMTQQLAQFASVEQQIAANQSLQSLLSLQQAASLVSAAPLVGQRVEVASDRLVLRGGAAQQVVLPSAAEAGGAARARIAVSDASGNLVREAIVPLGAPWSWDGRNGAGRAAPDGTYTLAVTGLDAQGGTRGALTASVAGTVTGITRGDGGAPRLSLGGLTVDLPALRRMY